MEVSSGLPRLLYATKRKKGNNLVGSVDFGRTERTHPSCPSLVLECLLKSPQLEEREPTIRKSCDVRRLVAQDAIVRGKSAPQILAGHRTGRLDVEPVRRRQALG